jgi:hypothetical protein
LSVTREVIVGAKIVLENVVDKNETQEQIFLESIARLLRCKRIDCCVAVKASISSLTDKNSPYQQLALMALQWEIYIS